MITLNTSYLDSLSAGQHTIKVNYIDGSTDGNDIFNITVSDGTCEDDSATDKSTTKEESPFTGDNMNVMFYVVLAMLGLLCIAIMVLLFIRKKGR